MYAPRPASTTMRAMVDLRPRMIGFPPPDAAAPLPPPPPGVDARGEDEPRDQQQRQDGQVVLLRRGERDPAILGVLGPDRDQVLLLRQPSERIHEQVAVPLDPER